MSTTTTSVAPTPTNDCGVFLFQMPVEDAVCAMAYSDDSVGYMKTCCKGADIVSYYDDCGVYCAAVGQSIEDLTDCLYDEGAAYEGVFCSGKKNATATGDGEPLPSSTSRVIDGDDDDSDDSNDDGGKDDGKDDGDSSSDDSKDDDDSSAPRSGAGAATLAVGTLLLSAMLAAL
ncbi:hypothetical protein N3K66_008570 [Trichothecium roseum]|uniref:Uncharacterized protein n=1 Tax=Trichothecium roseum TaxID=47278 RepID=A0ACC0UQL3_9HYPO|nr:hypothetical protein N3K66_008570 [Trichothecium roseum]